MTFTPLIVYLNSLDAVCEGNAVRNRTSSLLKTVTMIVAMIMTMGANAYESAYDKTPVGVIDVRELPSGR